MPDQQKENGENHQKDRDPEKKRQTSFALNGGMVETPACGWDAQAVTEKTAQRVFFAFEA